MKKYILAILFVFYTCSSCFGDPSIEFKKNKHYFGRVKQNSTYKWVFSFKNSGSSTLVIEKIEAG